MRMESYVILDTTCFFIECSLLRLRDALVKVFNPLFIGIFQC